jgi:hypothetical protein
MNRHANTPILLTLFAIILLFTLPSCGGGSSGSGGDDDTLTENPAGKDTHYPGEYFDDVDEEELLNTPRDTVVETVSNDASITTSPTSDPKVVIPDTEVVDEAEDGGSITLVLGAGVDQESLGTPLFVDGVFKGIVTSVQETESEVVVGLRDAEDVSEVYDSFEVEFRNDEFRDRALRALRKAVAHRHLGRYDQLNEEPLAVSILGKRVLNKGTGATSDEIILRIDIPDGYYVPVRKMGLDCSFVDANCTLTIQGDAVNKIDLGNEYVNGGITFTTKGSYIEIGLGSYIKARYDKNILSADLFEFELAQSAYFESNMVASVSGELGSNWSTQLDLLFDFEVEIAHPYSLVAKTSVVIDPNIVFGVEGKIKGTLTATSKVNRSGEVRFKYSSAAGITEANNNIQYVPKDINNDGVTVSIEAEGHAWVMPALTMLPSLKFLRINLPITFVFIRSGLKLNNEIKGKISSSFTVENDGLMEEKYGTEVSFTTSVYGLVQGKWFVRAAGIDFYYSPDYTDLFKTGALNILEWKAQLLDPPDILVEDHIEGDVKNISFSIPVDAKLEPHIYYYYAIGDRDHPPDDMPAETIETHPLFWKSGDDLIEVDSNSVIKARAVLYNEDVSTSIWSWGTSVSQQKTSYLVDIEPPDVTPESRSFESTLYITIEQSQGFDIYYRVNSGTAQLYSGPFEIHDDTTLIAYASDMVDGSHVRSETVTHTYEKCAEGDVLDEEGECYTPIVIEVEICDDGIDNDGDGQIDEGCEEPYGACCDGGGTCTTVTEAECAQSGGTYAGDYTNCSADLCSQPEYLIWYTGNVNCWGAPWLYISERESFNETGYRCNYPGGGIDCSQELEKVEVQGGFATWSEAADWVCPKITGAHFSYWCGGPRAHWIVTGQTLDFRLGIGCGDLSHVPDVEIPDPHPYP